MQWRLAALLAQHAEVLPTQFWNVLLLQSCKLFPQAHVFCVEGLDYGGRCIQICTQVPGRFLRFPEFPPVFQLRFTFGSVVAALVADGEIPTG